MVQPAGIEAVDEVVRVSGVVEVPPGDRAAASSGLAGTLVRLQVDRAEPVRAGQVVAEVHSLELLSLQLDLLKEHMTAELQTRQLESARAAGGAFSRRRMVELEGQFRATTTRRDSLRRRLSVVGLTPTAIDDVLASRRPAESVPVRAPIAGLVAGFDTALGRRVRADEPLVSIVNASKPLVRAYISDRDFVSVRVGQAAGCDSSPTRRLPTRAQSCAPRACSKANRERHRSGSN